MPDKNVEKSQLHPRNKHRQRYDFQALTLACPELSDFVQLNNYGDTSIDFFNPEAVKMLNKALLAYHYGIHNWDILQGYLCPPIPSRADYVHHIADVLATKNGGKIPVGKALKCLDVGVGANGIYPIIGHKAYGWSFIGADIDPVSLESVGKIIESNPSLKDAIDLRLQTDSRDTINGILKRGERIDATFCNPPFHASRAEAQAGTQRKLNNLKGTKAAKLSLNFGGQNNELWCEGGEVEFIKNMMVQSRQYADSCFWYSTLVSKQTTLKLILATLKQLEALEIKTIDMKHGNKMSRIVVWTFLTEKEQRQWIKTW
jgi:23S rRNA (adenine1618-N6)-methyltransferase